MSASAPAKLCICLLTYNRIVYAEATLKAVLDNVRWSGELHVHIADDGSPAGYVDRLRALAGGYLRVHSVGVSCSERGGYGRNYNLASQHIHPWADYALMLEDDWVLTRELDVDDLVHIFDSDSGIGCLRLGYLGATQDLRGVFHWQGKHPLWLLDPDSPEPHVWAGHPRLETVAWQRAQGAWYEGYDPNQTEFFMAHIIRAGIAWPAWLPAEGGLFQHIGAERARD